MPVKNVSNIRFVPPDPSAVGSEYQIDVDYTYLGKQYHETLRIDSGEVEQARNFKELVISKLSGGG